MIAKIKLVVYLVCLHYKNGITVITGQLKNIKFSDIPKQEIARNTKPS